MLKRKLEEEEKEEDEGPSKYNLLLNSLQLNNSNEIEKVKKKIKKSKKEYLPQITSSLSFEVKTTKKKKKIDKNEMDIPYPIPGDSNPFASEVKLFKKNMKFCENETNDVEDKNFDKEKTCINFTKKKLDFWFNHFYKPRNQKELSLISSTYDEKEHQFKKISNYETIGPTVLSTTDDLQLPKKNLFNSFVECDLIENWFDYLDVLELSNDKSDFRNSFQQSIFSIMNQYKDFYYPYRTIENEASIIEAYTLHAVNHLLKVKRYEWNNDSKAESNENYEVKDKSFTPQKILILVPFRHTAYIIVEIMMRLIPKLKSIRKKEAFEMTFTDNEASMGGKPLWYQQIFKGNIDDSFCLGLQLHNGQFEIMTKYFESDILIATPLGIQKENNNDRMTRMLSSVELCIVDQADVIQMQNWEHMINTFDLLNIDVKSNPNTGVDFTRIRDFNLYGKAKYFRQTLIFSSFMTPDINSLFNGDSCKNMLGKVKVRNTYSSIIPEGLPQIFQRLDCENIEEVDDIRFNYFTLTLFPKLNKVTDGEFLIICSSYLDFIRLKNYFEDRREDYTGLSEYTDNTRTSLQQFKKQNLRFLLYTERHFYFNGISPKDFPVNHVIFYTLPENAFMYTSFAAKCIAKRKFYAPSNLML
eukprot:gene8125-12585_t